MAQDVLLIAMEKVAHDWSTPERFPWLSGVVRKQAAFRARSAVRRRKRERSEHMCSGATNQLSWDKSFRFEQGFLGTLPRSLRSVARLASADLSSNEIRWLLGLSPTALRARLSALRRAARSEDELPVVTKVATGPAFGGRRPLVLSQLKRTSGRSVATLDPDGHALFFREVAHKTGRAGNSQ